MKRRSIFRGLTSLVSLGWMVAFGQGQAQDFRITKIYLGLDGKFHLEYTADTNSYYILYRGNAVTNIAQATEIALGKGSIGQLGDSTSLAQSAAVYYRILSVPLAHPLDSDNDGIDDVYELQHAQLLNPLNTADALLDSDGDGRNNFQEYLAAKASLITIRETSPANGEGGVAVTRETIIRFSEPLGESAIITRTNFFAEFGGRRLLTRAELSSDRKTATLFYVENLPGSARVRVTFEGNSVADSMGRAVDADGDGKPGGVARIDFDTLTITPVAQTAVMGRVFASDPMSGTKTTNFVNRPLQGVTITVDGMEETLRTTTDAGGNFKLQPAPSGRFFVHVDGRTAVGSQWPNGSYYPFVGKAWEAVAGRTNNLAGADGLIYLPLILTGTLQSVSPTNNTIITFPPSVIATNASFAGVSITVPANALFSENGARGGKVGIAPVPPDRLPEKLPPGLNFPIVITIQTDGPQNFDRPVPVRFPNLPDPVTGKKLGPGEKSALWSFNHDTGRWEIQGPMTVTADGNYVESDAGVGVRQPGWHGVQPGASIDGSVVYGIFDSREVYRQAAAAGKEGLELAWAFVDSASQAVEGAAGLLTEGPLATPVKVIAGLGIVINLHQCLTSPNLQDCGSLALQTAGLFVEAGTPVGWAIAVANLGLGIVNVSDKLRDVGARMDAAESANTSRGQKLSVGAKAAEENRPGPASNLVDELLRKVGMQEPKLRRVHELAKTIRNFATNSNPTEPRLGLSDSDLAQWRSALTEYLALSEELERQGLFLTELMRFAQLCQGIGAKSATTVQKFTAGDFFVSYEYSGIVLRERSGTSLINRPLPPKTLARVQIYEAKTGLSAVWFGATGENGSRSDVGDLVAAPAGGVDDDQDGLPNEVELIIGTSIKSPDTDNDGVSDAGEVQQGTDPLSNLAVLTGLIASAPTPGSAVDICVLNDIAIVANGDAGITVLNVVNGLNPTRIAQVDTPGNAQRVACSGNFISVADGAAGLAVVDINDPPAARIIHQLNFGTGAHAVTASGGIAYVGLGSGQLASVDMRTGTLVEQLSLAEAVQDLVFAGDFLYALTTTRLHVVAPFDGLRVIGSVSTSGGGKRLFVGGGIGYVTHSTGYTTFNLSNPAQPALMFPGTSQQRGWQQLVANGSGLGVAAVGVNGPDDVNLYDVSDPTKTDRFLTTLVTPGQAQAVSIYNGLAYVADGAAGMQVINYLAYDNKGVAPTVSLFNSFTNNLTEEGKTVRLTANVTDDVQVRNVEFYVDGVKVATDGNFPFEHRFVAPIRSTTRTNFTVRAKATDTGGNARWTEELNVALTSDVTPPRIIRVFPVQSAIVGSVNLISVFFSEALSSAALTAASLQLKSAGADGIPGTTDDSDVAGSTLSYRSELNAAFFTFAGDLPAGAYQATIKPPIADLTGNATTNPFIWRFWVIRGKDTDHDGITDEVELTLGLNPYSSDSNGNGIMDGDEDFDGDGLRTSAEILLLYGPRKPDTNGNGVADGQEDLDGDGLINTVEQQRGTNLALADSDGDGFDDATEIFDGTNPWDRTSGPRFTVTTLTSVSFLNALPEAPPANIALSVTSPAAAYLNAMPELSGTSVFAISPLLSYSNRAPAQLNSLNRTKPQKDKDYEIQLSR